MHWQAASFIRLTALSITIGISLPVHAIENPVVPNAKLGTLRHGTYPSVGVGDGDRTHVGVDLVAPCGSNVYAFADGHVVDVIKTDQDRNFANEEGYGLGYMVLIEHPVRFLSKPFYTLYLHLDEAPSLSIDAPVRGGKTPIGVVGDTGTGPYGCHTHFEARHFPTRFLSQSDESAKKWNNIFGGGDQVNSHLLSQYWMDPEILFKDYPKGLTELVRVEGSFEGTVSGISAKGKGVSVPSNIVRGDAVIGRFIYSEKDAVATPHPAIPNKGKIYTFNKGRSPYGLEITIKGLKWRSGKGFAVTVFDDHPNPDDDWFWVYLNVAGHGPPFNTLGYGPPSLFPGSLGRDRADFFARKEKLFSNLDLPTFLGRTNTSDLFSQGWIISEDPSAKPNTKVWKVGFNITRSSIKAYSIADQDSSKSREYTASVDYYPIDEGITRDFKIIRDLEGLKQSVNLRIKTLSEHNFFGKKLVPWQDDSGNLLYVKKDETGVAEFGFQKIDMASPKIHEEPKYVYKNPISVWTGWRDIRKVRGGIFDKPVAVDVFCEIETLQDTVTVIAGTFSDCMRIKCSGSAIKDAGLGRKAEYSIQSTYWLAPDVGLVKKIEQQKKEGPVPYSSSQVVQLEALSP